MESTLEVARRAVEADTRRDWASGAQRRASRLVPSAACAAVARAAPLYAPSAARAGSAHALRARAPGEAATATERSALRPQPTRCTCRPPLSWTPSRSTPAPRARPRSCRVRRPVLCAGEGWARRGPSAHALAPRSYPRQGRGVPPARAGHRAVGASPAAVRSRRHAALTGAHASQAQAQGMATMAQAAQVGAGLASQGTQAVRAAGGAQTMGAAATLAAVAGAVVMGPLTVPPLLMLSKLRMLTPWRRRLWWRARALRTRRRAETTWATLRAQPASRR